MNTTSLSRSAIWSTAVAFAGVWMGGELFTSAQTNAPPTASDTKPASEFTPVEPGQYNNWVDLAFGLNLVSDDKAQFQQRHQVPGDPYGGVEDFHWEKPVQKQGIFTIDGHAIFDNHDYSLTIGISHPDRGYVRAGYRQFRTWYDGSGGFFPQNGQWFNLYDDQLALDRGEAWIEAGLTLPDIPVITFRYSHQFRDGQKDSTIWGDTALTGGLGTRAIVPTFYDIDERRDIFQLDVKHTIGKTEFGLGGQADFLNQDNSLNIRRRPGETGTTAAGAGNSIDRYVSQINDVRADSYNIHAFTDTQFSDKVRLTLGGAYTSTDTDISGSRIYGASYDAVFDPLFAARQERDSGFFDLGGGATWKQTVANINLMIVPCENLNLVPSLRIENSEQNGIASFTSTDVGAAPTFTSTEEDLVNEQRRGYTELTEALELRYSGVTNWVYYVRGEWAEAEGTLFEQQANLELPPPSTTIDRKTDSTRFTQKYVLGINWYPHRRVNLALQCYHKAQVNDFDNTEDSTPNDPTSGNRYPAFIMAQNFKTDDANFRITWRPCSYVSSVSRYDFQLSTIDMTGDFLAPVQSGHLVSHIISESLTLSPWNPVYVQLNGTYVFDELNTPATSQPGAAADLVTKSQNGYWNAGALIGVTLDRRTDVQLAYSFYQSDDYNNNSAVSTPYGNSSREHGVTVTLNRMLTPRVRWSIKYGFFDYNDFTSGGNNDYTAHMIYTNLQYRF